MAMVNDALPAIRETLDKYVLCDIYNMDETGLFYRMQGRKNPLVSKPWGNALNGLLPTTKKPTVST
ncbi:TRANSPOSON [Plasmopara halstedii]|uniref:TRANSPOSON n=1 Tax=Plasmopara halstedii TaxID=4781 RepID=A0A0P1ASJ3_PLAHL|nr:TRANSPOSON [Plasmopara halstedii]CEG44272.1 TRANSPOSON [Plasmopara halstedii]|eukprot:XP_024580641.1 TRANSPOSON [Plasmopara halstedii]